MYRVYNHTAAHDVKFGIIGITLCVKQRSII